ncbi:MAG TPA: hypothetical protein DCP11_15870 [Microbacteriaceae bacterium]|nr:hypothetical protein [Microbacteriaceae bacterium]
MNGNEYSGPSTRLPAGQTHPGTVAPDHRDAAGVASPAANTRVTAITGIVLGLIPLLSPIGLVLSLVALRGYRKVQARPTLAVVGIIVNSMVLVGSVVFFFLLPGNLPAGG